ncbi:hypothetical protein ATY75_12135 [Rhizobium sp. N122]|nr:hypothetical protein ATY75_12135 [Rhizobium sp. N122]
MNIRPTVDINKAAEMWADDASIGDIAAHFGVSRGKISGIMGRDRERFPQKTKGKMAKNRAAGNGNGVSKVAFGAAPGKSLPTRSNGGHAGHKLFNVHKARIEAARREAAEFQAGTSAYLQIAPDDALRLETGKELMDLAAHDCRWPVSNISPFRFCAHKQFQGSSYCAHHMLRSLPKEAREG